MKYLIKKMLRSVSSFKIQFLSVLVLSVLSVIIYSGLEGVWSSMDKEFTSYSEETNLADEWVSAVYFTEEDVKAVRNMDGVDEVSVRTRLNVESNGTYLSLDVLDDNRITSMKIMEGENWNANFKNSIWIDQDYAAALDIKVGDIMEIALGDKSVNPVVKGIILSAERTHFVGTTDYYAPAHNEYGYGCISEDLKPELGLMIYGNLLEIKSNASDVKENIRDLLGERFITYYDRTTNPDVYFIRNQVRNLRAVSILFSGLFILLSVLSMNTTIRRIIDAQAKDIITLKALGFSNKGLIIYYSMYRFAVSFLGAGMGFVLSYPFTSVIRQTQIYLFSLPEWPVTHTPLLMVVIFVIVFLCTFTSVLAAGKTMKGLPAENKDTKSTTKGEKIRFKKMAYGMRWSVRDGFSHKTRIFLGILCVTGSYMLLMTGFGMPDSLTAVIEKIFEEQYNYEYKINLQTNFLNSGLTPLYEEIEGQTMEVLQAGIEGKDGEPHFEPLMIISEGEYVNFKTTDGKKIENDGLYLTERIADILGLEAGDEVKISPSLHEGEITLKVAGLISASMPQSMFIREECFTLAGGNYMPSSILTDKINDNIKEDVRVSQIVSNAKQTNNLKEFKAAMLGVFILMRSIAVILVVIILYNLGTLSFIERTKEYNTFRVLGFHYHEIQKLASVENFMILIIGTIFGIPAGYRFLQTYCNTFSNDTFVIYPDLFKTNLVLVCIVVTVSTLITTMFLAMRIRKINMVEALKAY